MPEQTERPPALALREAAHLVSPRAVSYWRLGAWTLFGVLTAAWVALIFVGRDQAWPWWSYAAPAVLPLAALVRAVVMPGLRFRVHRWEVTDTAIYTKEGWISLRTEVAPLSRVQTVDSAQGPLMRWFKLASVVVTTASMHGAVTVRCLDQDVAHEVVAHLVTITGASKGDAT